MEKNEKMKKRKDEKNGLVGWLVGLTNKIGYTRVKVDDSYAQLPCIGLCRPWINLPFGDG